jgi:hypothetical protein
MADENLHTDNAAEVVMRWVRRAANGVVRFVMEFKQGLRELDSRIRG